MDAPARPLPRIDANSAPYWTAANEGRLSMPHCAECGQWNFPPLPRCKYCLSARLEWSDLSGRGTVHSYCVMRTDLVRGFEPPYAVVQVRLEEQADLVVTANMMDCAIDDIAIGQRVAVCFERRSVAINMPQFAPEAGHAPGPRSPGATSGAEDRS